jgi:putative RecB family exonuclease
MGDRKPLFDATRLHISHSAVSEYTLCPEKFRQHYVRRTRPTHSSCDAVFGTTIHAALATFHTRIKETGVRPPLDGLLEEFDARFTAAAREPLPILWTDEDSPEQLRAQGHELLMIYYHEAGVHRVLSVEQPFTLAPEEWGAPADHDEALSGIVDLVEQDADGTTFVSELKTAARAFDDLRLTHDRQVSIYALARRALGVPNAHLRFRVLVKGKKPRLETIEVRRDDAQLQEARTVVAGVLKAVRHGIFYPLRTWACGGCAYRPACGES